MNVIIKRMTHSDLKRKGMLTLMFKYISNYNTWLQITNTLFNERLSENDDIIMFGSSLYKQGRDFDICVVFSNIFNVQYFMYRVEHTVKKIEKKINKNIDVCYLFGEEIEKDIKNALIFNIILRTGISARGIDYSKFFAIPNQTVYNDSDSRLTYFLNIIKHELEQENKNLNLIEDTKDIMVKELSIRMSVDKNINGYDLYSLYRNFRYILEKVDLDNFIRITEELIKEGKGEEIRDYIR